MPDASPAIIDLVQELIRMVRGIDPAWTRAYLRFDISPGQHGCRASYTVGTNTMLVDTVRHKHAMHSLGDKGVTIFEALSKSQGVLLVTSDSKRRYNIHFEYEDLGRWMISKLNGGTGVPAGFDPASPDNPAG